jgi:tetratricopeptide (TPR) repeat protein
LKRPAEALSIQRELLSETKDDGYIYEELGECLLALGKPEEAQPHFADAYRLLAEDPWLSRDEPGRLQRLQELGAAE